MKKRPKSGTSRAKRPGRTLAYPVEFRLRMVRLFLEEGYSAKVLGEQFGVSCHSIHRWVRAYRGQGAEGLEPKRHTSGSSRQSAEVRQRVINL